MPSQPETVNAEYVAGAVVSLLCEDDCVAVPGHVCDPHGLWRLGTIIKREACNTAAERRMGTMAAGRHRSSEVSALQDVPALRVCQQGPGGDWHVLPWLTLPGQQRSNQAVPQGVWATHVKLVQRSPTRVMGTAGTAGAATTPMSTPLDIGKLPGGMAEHEHGTLRGMRAFSTAHGDAALDPGQLDESAFNGRYFDGHGGGTVSTTGNPSHDSLLGQLPGKRVTQEIFKAAGVPLEEWRSAKLCETFHVAANILSVDLAHWANMAKREADDDAEVVDVAQMLGCTQASDPIAAFQAIPSGSLKVFLLTLSSVQYLHDTPGNLHHAFDTARTIKNLQDHRKLAKRCLRLLAIISQLAKATQSKGGLVELQPHQLHFALLLILDNGGLKDESIDRLSRHGVCDSAHEARAAIKVASGLINAGIFRNDGDDQEAILYAADNADIHKYGVEHNFVAVCAIQLGWTLTKDETDEVTQGFKDMPEPSMEHCSDIAMSAADDAALTEMTLHPVNILALWHAAALLSAVDRASEAGSDSAAPMDTDELVVRGATVDFNKSGIPRQGTVTQVEGDTCMIAVDTSDGDSTVYTTPVAKVKVVVESSTTEDIFMQLPKTHPIPGPPPPPFGVHKFKGSLTLTTDVLTEVSSKHKEASWQVLRSIAHSSKHLNEMWQAITVDFEFYIYIALSFFISGLFIIPIIAFGHLAKCAAASMFTYYEFFYFRTLCAAAGLQPGTPKFAKLMKCTHISESLKALNQHQLALRIALGSEFLKDVGGKKLTGHQWTIREIAMDLQLSGEEQRQRDKPVFEQIVLDSTCRPIDLAYGQLSVDISVEFMAWCDRRAANGCDLTGVVYDPDTHGSGGAGDGQLHAGVADEHTEIFKLKYYGDNGLRRRCESLGIEMGRNPNTLLLREKLYKYYTVGDGALGGAVVDPAAGIAAAAAVTEIDGVQQRLPGVPDAVNTNVKVLTDFLSEEIVPFLLLLRLMRVRDKDECCSYVLPHGCPTCENGRCTCSARYPMVVCSKAMLQNVFLRRQPNYQRAMILFVYFLVLVNKHSSDAFQNIVYRHIGTAMALSSTGSSDKCQPGDLHQEGANVAVVKNAACRNPSSSVMSRARALVASFTKYERQRVQNEEPDLPAKSCRLNATQKEQRYHDAFMAMLSVSATIVTEVLAADGSVQVAMQPDRELQDRSKTWMRVAIAKANCQQASIVTVAGVKGKISYKLKNPKHGALGAAHKAQPVKRGQTQAEVEAVQARREQQEQLEQLINVTERVPCQPANAVDMFWPPSANLGGGKSRAGEVLISSLMNFSEADAATGVHRKAVNVFKDSGYLQQFFIDSNGDLTDEPTDRSIVIVDVLQYLVSHPKFRDGRGGTICELARAIILAVLRLYLLIQAAEPQPMLIFAMDAAEFMTHLRQLQRKKRKKGMVGTHGTDAATYATRAADTLLEALGQYRELMKSGSFRVRLAAQITFEFTNENDAEGWALPGSGTNLTFVFIGGGDEVCVSHRGDPSQVPFTKNATVTTAQLREALADVPKQAEGER